MKENTDKFREFSSLLVYSQNKVDLQEIGWSIILSLYPSIPHKGNSVGF